MDATLRVRAMLSFVQAADRGSFAAAARALGISAAAVGKNVAGLEAALGVRLMNRSTRSLQLTGEGQAFLDRAREAINALDEAIDTVAAQRADPVGRVRISTGHATGQRFLMPLLPGLVERHPGLVPEVVFEDRRVDLVRDGFDLALRGGLLVDSNLVSREICELRTLLVASPAYLARHGIPKKVDDLWRHRLIAVRFLSGQTASWTFRIGAGPVEERPPAPSALVVSDPQAASEAAVSGMGIAQAGLHHAWDHLHEGRLQVVLPRLHHSAHRTLALQYPHRSLVAPRVRATVDYLLDAFSRIDGLHVTWAQVRALAA